LTSPTFQHRAPANARAGPTSTRNEATDATVDAVAICFIEADRDCSGEKSTRLMVDFEDGTVYAEEDVKPNIATSAVAVLIMLSELYWRERERAPALFGSLRLRLLVGLVLVGTRELFTITLMYFIES
jgi:hypothetical protein